MFLKKPSVPWMRAGMALMALACCALGVWGDGDPLGDPGGEEEGAPPGSRVFTWKALPYSVGAMQVCWFDEAAEATGHFSGVVCHDACPSNGICAEFSNEDGGVVDLVCCIDPEIEGSSNVGDCVLEATLVRSGGPPELWDIPWL